MRFFSGFALFAFALAVLPAQSAQPLPAAGWTNLPAWRGFNLLNERFGRTIRKCMF